MANWREKMRLKNYLSDEALMRAYASSDQDAFTQLYERHKRSLYYFILRQTNRQSVCEELVHDVWLAVIRQSAHYQNTAKFKTWLFRIAHNRLVDYWRRQKHRSKLIVVDELDELAVAQCEIDESLRLKELSGCLEQLSPEQLSTMLLKVEGFSYAEISDITKTKKETVKSRLRYATKNLKLSLEAVL